MVVSIHLKANVVGVIAQPIRRGCKIAGVYYSKVK